MNGRLRAGNGTGAPARGAVPHGTPLVSRRGDGHTTRTMTGRRSVVTITLVVVLAAAGCAGDLPPAITPPPPADVVAWPEMTWGSSFFARPPDGWTSERVEAVAASDEGFVAVGLAEANGRERGQVWFSVDGIAWDRVVPADRFDGVTLIDVAAGPSGFVAVGTSSGDPFLAKESRLVLFRSPDGKRWERVPDDAATPPGIATGVGGGPLGYVAVGFTDPEPGPILLVSADGLVWRTIKAAAAGDAAGGIGTPVAVDGGWLAVGGPPGTLSVLRSDDGARWESTAVEGSGTNGTHVSRVLAGPAGLLATGGASDGCGPFSSCPGQAVAWWSADGATWGRIAAFDQSIANGAMTADPERGFVSVTGSAAWTSADGWSWAPLGEVAAGELGARDVVFRGDRIVVVGDKYEADASTRVMFLVGGPDIEVLN